MVDDIVVKKSNVIFILESPHTEEVDGGMPLLGASGNVFSRALLPDKTKPAGLQIKEGKIPFSVINTFQNALQLSEDLKGLNTAIKQVNFSKLGLVRYKNEINNIIKTNTQSLSLVDSYKERVNSTIECSIKNVKIVVCGIIAQVYFEYAFDLSGMLFGSVQIKEVMDKKFEILYVEHPSPKNSTTHWSPTHNNTRYSFFEKFVNSYKIK